MFAPDSSPRAQINFNTMLVGQTAMPLVACLCIFVFYFAKRFKIGRKEKKKVRELGDQCAGLFLFITYFDGAEVLYRKLRRLRYRVAHSSIWRKRMGPLFLLRYLHEDVSTETWTAVKAVVGDLLLALRGDEVLFVREVDGPADVTVVAS